MLHYVVYFVLLAEPLARMKTVFVNGQIVRIGSKHRETRDENDRPAKRRRTEPKSIVNNPLWKEKNLDEESPCPFGENHVPIEDHTEAICVNCGIVMFEGAAESDVEWAKNKSGIDLPAQFDRHGHYSTLSKLMGSDSPATSLDFSRCNYSLRARPRMAESKTERTLHKGYTAINDLCDRFCITDEALKDDAFLILKKCYESKLFKSEETIPRFAAVSLYIASVKGTPRDLVELQRWCGEDKKVLTDTCAAVMKELNGRAKNAKKGGIDRGDLLKSLPRYVAMLGVKESKKKGEKNRCFLVEKETLHIMKRIKELGAKINTCMNDSLLIPAALLASVCVHAEELCDGPRLERTAAELMSQFEITKLNSLVNSYNKDIKENAAVLLSEPAKMVRKLRKLAIVKETKKRDGAREELFVLKWC